MAIRYSKLDGLMLARYSSAFDFQVSIVFVKYSVSVKLLYSIICNSFCYYIVNIYLFNS